jgi:predicted secreted protein
MDLIEKSAAGDAQAKQIIMLATGHHQQHGQMLAQAMGMLQPAGNSQGSQSEKSASEAQGATPDNRANA